MNLFSNSSSSLHNQLTSPQYWGNRYWFVLHFTASTAPESFKDKSEEKKDYENFFKSFFKILPCEECKKHSGEMLTENPLVFETRDELFEWTVTLHNIVNRRLQKRVISLPIMRRSYGLASLPPKPVLQETPTVSKETPTVSRETPIVSRETPIVSKEIQSKERSAPVPRSFDMSTPTVPKKSFNQNLYQKASFMNQLNANGGVNNGGMGGGSRSIQKSRSTRSVAGNVTNPTFPRTTTPVVSREPPIVPQGPVKARPKKKCNCGRR